MYIKFGVHGPLIITLCVYRWQRLLSDADARKKRLLRLQEQYRQVEDLYLTFAKKASAFNSWFENAEEDLTDPVRCNSVEEIKVSLASSRLIQSAMITSSSDSWCIRCSGN